MPDEHDLTRRSLLFAATFVPLAALTAAAQTGPVALTPEQMKTLEAFIDRLIPTDELGPGAVEALAQVYIDRALAGPNANEKAQFLEGLEAVNAYAQRTQGASLADLPAEKRDLVLKAIDENIAEGLPQGRQFFNRARRLTLEGMFGDPYYGGNGAFAGWDLIRYPGPRPAVDAEMQGMDVAPVPYHHSAWGTQYK
jgi:gluconate 2-dehydrogenase gamma chain